MRFEKLKERRDVIFWFVLLWGLIIYHGFIEELRPTNFEVLLIIILAVIDIHILHLKERRMEDG